MVLIQALLLLQWWNPKTNDQKDPWHWLGICVSLANSLGLNDPDAHLSLPTKTCRLWRRLWWSCVTMDRLYCIAVRKPLRIREQDIIIPPPSFRDFDVHPLRTEISALENVPLITDCVEQVMQADMFMAQVRLLRIVGRIMERMYTLQRFSGNSCDWAMFYVPRKENDLNCRVYEELQRELDSWSNTLNDYCKPNYEGESIHDVSRRPLIVCRSLLRLVYLLAVETIHRPCSIPALHTAADLANPPSQAHEAKAHAKEAVREMFDIIHTYRQSGLLRFLTAISVTCILTVAASCAMEMRTTAVSDRNLASSNNTHQDQYDECIVCLEALHDVWPITKASCAMARRMVSSDQTSFARNLRMLSTPVGETPSAADIEPQAGQNLQEPHASSSSSTGNTALQIQPAASMSQLNDDSGCIDASLSSIYSAAMYPYYHVEPDLTFTDNLGFLDPSTFLQ